MKSNVIFVKFRTRLQSTDFVVVLLVPYKILISRTSTRTRTKRIRLNRTYTPCTLNLIPCRSYETSVSFSIRPAFFWSAAGLNPEPVNGYRLFNAGVHERLYELPLEEQKGNEQGGYGHQSGCGDNRPVDAGFRGAEDTQSNRQRSGFH